MPRTGALRRVESRIRDRVRHRLEVYGLCMYRINVDINDEACAAIISRYSLSFRVRGGEPRAAHAKYQLLAPKNCP